MTEPLGELGQVASGPTVSLRGEAQVGDRIAFQAVGAALQDDELRSMPLNMLHDCRPDRVEDGIVGTRGQGDVELGAAGRASPLLLGPASARIEVMPVLVDIGK